MANTTDKKNKRKKPIANNLPKCESGNICKYALEYQDIPNKFADLKFRFIYTIISFVILGFNQGPGNYFFTSMLMFSVPLFYDNLKFDPHEKSRNIIKTISIIILGIQCLLGIFGMIGILECIEYKSLYVVISNKFMIFGNFKFKLVYLWLFMSIDIILTGADTIIARSKFGEALSKVYQ